MLSRNDFLKSLAVLGVAPMLSGSAAEATEGGGGVIYRRELKVKHDVDVFIAGGGPAGAAAAVAAAEQGLRVFLAEAHTCFGGMGTAALVPVFMQTSDGEHDLIGGFGRRFINRLSREKRHGGANDIETMKVVYDAMLSEAGVKFSFYTRLADVVSRDGRVDYAVCAAPSGMFAVRAKVFIDCTGDGCLSVWAGAEWKQGDANGHVMPASLLALWSGIDWETWTKEVKSLRREQPYGQFLEKAIADGVFSVPDLHATGMYRLPHGMGNSNLGHIFDIDGTDELSLTRGMTEGRRTLKEYERYLRDYLKRGYENVRVAASASLLGVRETRRITGDYVLSLADYKNRASFPDEIGRFAYPIDIHPSSADKAAYERHREEFDRLYKYRKGESYGIPYRCLTPKGFDNLLVAGRCVSSDEMVQASIRVMPACYITGQACGIAAAMACRAGVSTRRIDAAKLRAKLKDYGAYIV